jgi:hypothetical protein
MFARTFAASLFIVISSLSHFLSATMTNSAISPKTVAVLCDVADSQSSLTFYRHIVRLGILQP